MSTVSTPEELAAAIEAGTLDIIVTNHLDLTGLPLKCSLMLGIAIHDVPRSVAILCTGKSTHQGHHVQLLSSFRVCCWGKIATGSCFSIVTAAILKTVLYHWRWQSTLWQPCWYQQCCPAHVH